MIGYSVRIGLCTVLAFVVLSIPRMGAEAQTVAPLRIAIDASQAPQKIDHVRVTMPAMSGPVRVRLPNRFQAITAPTARSKRS